jgi:ABC-2 type transport system permease protein
MTAAIFSQALGEYTRFRRILPWVVLSLLCYGLAVFWPHLIPNSSPEDRYASVSSLMVFRLLALASAIFTTAILSQEIEGRTIVYLLTRPVPRWILIITRYAASVIVVAGLGCLAVAFTSLGSFGPKGGNPLLINDVKAVLFGAMSYGALFLLVSLLLNRAMIYCLLFAFGWETSIPSLPGDLYHISIYSYLQGIAQHPPTTLGRALSALTGGPVIQPATCDLVLTTLIVVSLVLSGWWFTHFEYVPREDAE